MKKLFLSHFHQEANIILALAKELRVRGIMPWVDKEGGFSVGNQCEETVRSAIRGDCFGLLFLASKHSLRRPFILEVELSEAIAIKEENSLFQIVSVLNGLKVATYRNQTKKLLSHDLSQYHLLCLTTEEHQVPEDLARIAKEILRTYVQTSTFPDQTVSIQFGTRTLFPTSNCDHFLIDGRHAYKTSDSGESFHQLLKGLQEIKSSLLEVQGIKLILLSGSKHYSAGFLFGRVFSRFPLSCLERSGQRWDTSSSAPTGQWFDKVDFSLGSSNLLVVTLATGSKALRDPVIRHFGTQNHAMLEIRSSCPITVTGESSQELAHQIYREIESAMQAGSFEEIHIFPSLPMVTLINVAQLFAGMPKTFVYDFNGETYECPGPIPAGVL